MTKKNNNTNAWSRLPGLLFFFMMTVILTICLFPRERQSGRNYLGAFEPNRLLLFVAGILLTVALVLLFKKTGLASRIKINKKFLLCAFLFSFVLQIVVSYHYYFVTDWDVKQVFDLSYAIAHQADVTEFKGYFSRYPNNLVLAYFFSLVISLAHKLGFHQLEYYALIVVQCFLNTAAGLLLITAIKQLFHNDFLCFLGYLFYLCLVGISPWVVVPYSDSMGLIFPVLILNIYLYKSEDTPEKSADSHWITDIVKWFLIALISYIGYKIKPQIIILLMGIILAEIYTKLVHFRQVKISLLKLIRIVTALCLGFVMAISLTNIMSQKTKVPLNPERAFGPAHFLMMGLNPETNGGYYRPDVDFSGSFATTAERNSANIAVAVERVKEMGPSNLRRHLINKVLINYNDGSFFWGGEGTFYKEVPEETNHLLCSFFRNIYYNRENPGKYYSAWFQFVQMIWITVLFFTALAGLRKQDTRQSAIMIALIGLTLFDLLFEARSRYLFAYVPLYIILAMWGIEMLISKKSNTNKSKSH